MRSPVEVVTRTAGRVTIARLAGEPDLTNVREVEQHLIGVIANTSIAAVLDLSGVRYLDSAGLNLLFSLQRALATRGQGLCLVVPERSLIRPLLEVVQIHAAIEIQPTLEAALRRVEQAEGQAGEAGARRGEAEGRAGEAEGRAEEDG